MKQTNFWSAAAKAGVIIAVVASLISALVITTEIAVLSFLSTATTIFLYWTSTAQYGKSKGDAGFSYGESLKFILAVSLCVGFVSGAYSILSMKVLFIEQAQKATADMMVALDQMSLSAEQITSFSTILSSPIFLLISSIFGSVVMGLIFGLIISIFTKREPAPFAEEHEVESIEVADEGEQSDDNTSAEDDK